MYRAVEIMRALDIRTYKPGVKASPRPSGLCAPSLVVALCNKRDHKLIALSRRNQLLVPELCYLNLNLGSHHRLSLIRVFKTSPQFHSHLSFLIDAQCCARRQGCCGQPLHSPRPLYTYTMSSCDEDQCNLRTPQRSVKTSVPRCNGRLSLARLFEPVLALTTPRGMSSSQSRLQCAPTGSVLARSATDVTGLVTEVADAARTAARPPEGSPCTLAAPP